MKKLLFGLAALPLLTGIAFAKSPAPANQVKAPVALSDTQMDGVTAGFAFFEHDFTNTSSTWVAVNQPTIYTCDTCYLNVLDTWFGTGLPHVQIISQFGPPAPQGTGG